MFCGMKKQTETTPVKSLRDAYKAPGFRVLANIDSYEHEPPAVVLTLDRRSKKRCAACAGSRAAAFTTNAGDARAISVAVTGKSISIFKCAA